MRGTIGFDLCQGGGQFRRNQGLSDIPSQCPPLTSVAVLPTISNIMVKPIFRTSEEELSRMGITDKIELSEDGLRTDPVRGFFEWWYFDAHMDDGSTVVIVYLTKSLMDYNGPMEPGVLITITRPDGVKLETSPTFKPIGETMYCLAPSL